MESCKVCEHLQKSKSSLRPDNLRTQVCSVLGISLGHILDGTVLAYTSTAIPSLSSTDQDRFSDSSPYMMSLVASAHSVGAMAACFVAGFLMCYFGRKGTTIAFTIPTYFVGYMIVAYADNLTTVIVGRLLTGMGLGFTLTVPNVYIVEITDPEYRGVLGVLPNFFCQIGIFSTYVLGRFFDWRMLAFSFAMFCIPFLLAVINIPESPDHKSKPLKSQCTNCKNNFGDSQESLDITFDKSKSFLSTMIKESNYKPFLAGLILMCFFQATAYPLLIGNTVTLFKETDSSMNEHLASIIVGMAIVIFSVVSMPLAKVFDRKLLLCVSSTGVSVCLFSLGTYYYLKDLSMAASLKWLPLVDFLTYIGFFMSGYGSVSWVLFAEILPPEVRSSAYPLGIGLMWLLNFVLTSLYDAMMDFMMASGFFWFYAILTAIGTGFILLYLPETRNKSPEEIALFYSKTRIVCDEEKPSKLNVSTMCSGSMTIEI